MQTSKIGAIIFTLGIGLVAISIIATASDYITKSEVNPIILCILTIGLICKVVGYLIINLSIKNRRESRNNTME